MTDPIPIRRPINWSRLREGDAERVVRERAQATENVFIGRHAYDRIGEREILQTDVYTILRTGYVHGPPVQEDEEWKVIMVLRMPGGRSAGVVTLFIRDNDELFVKTVEWMDWNR